jgi:type I restriction enzyme S subunit
MNLHRVTLSSLAEVRSGGGAPQESAAFTATGNPFVRAGSLIKLLNGASEESLEKLEPPVAEKHGLRLFPVGTVLFAKSGMSATKGHIYRLSKPAYVVNHLAALIPHEPSDGGFLVRALQKFPPTTLIKDPAYPSIRLSDIKDMSVLAPGEPAERKRIAEVLDRADALRAKRRTALDQLDTLAHALFLDLFGDPVINSRGWRRIPFGELLSNIDSGWSPRCLDRPISGNEWGVLKLGAVTWCEYNPAENKALPPDVAPRPDLEVKTGDLLFVRKNTYELVAACALVCGTPPRLQLPDLIFRFRLRSDAAVDASFLHQLLIYPTKRREIQKLAGGSAGSMPNISKTRLRTIPIEVPPFPLQERFARLVASVEKLKTAHRTSLVELDVLFAALQHCAFRGEL